MSRQNTGYNYQIWAMRAGNRSTGVMLSNGSSRSPPLFSLLIPIFRGRNQRFIMECTLLYTIAGYRPQCEVSSKVSQNSVKCTPESGHGKSSNSYSWTKKRPPPECAILIRKHCRAGKKRYSLRLCRFFHLCRVSKTFEISRIPIPL